MGQKPSILLICVLLGVLTFGIYGQTARHQFNNFDVPAYVTENKMVQKGLSWPGVVWAFTTFQSAEWLPVTWLSYMTDYEFFGLDSGAFHLSNVFFHLTSVILLFLVFADMTGRPYRAAAVALLFAAHPLRVESVVWIAERKDVLSLFFFLLTLKAYEIYIRKPQKYSYALMLIFFALGLMSKIMLITAPFLFLILDYWPFARLHSRRDLPLLLKEKIPMLLLAAGSGALNFWALRKAGGITPFGLLPLTARLQNIVISYARYLKKTFWPIHLAHFYPYHKEFFNFFTVGGSLLCLAGITVAAFRMHKKNPAILAGWLWFVLALFPVIGLIQAGTQSIADRYTYLPHIGLLWMLVWIICEGFERLKISPTFRAIGFVSLAFPLAFLSWRQTGYWQNSEMLNRHTLKVTGANYLAHENLGYALAKAKRYEEARKHYEKALQIEPHRVRDIYNLGLIALAQARYSEAENCFQRVLKLRPKNVEALSSLGVVAIKTNKPEQAMDYFMKALTADSKYIPARKGLTYAYLQSHRLREAQFHLEILKRNPGKKDLDILVLSGLLASGKRNFEEALTIYQKILERKPKSVEALFALGNLSLNLKRYSEAVSYYSKALQIDPLLPNVHKNLGIALGKQGDFEKAESHFKKALKLKPNFARVHYRWGRMLTTQGKWQEAELHYKEAERLNPELPGLKTALDELAHRSH